jgi:Ca2+-dependent lipid-binding protein
VEQLWPNVTVAAAKITKDIVEPILASTLPGPLSSLRFVKLELGHVPIRFSNVDVHKTTNQGIKLDLDLDWEGVCDIELDGNRVPKIVSFETSCHTSFELHLTKLKNPGHRKGPAEGPTQHLALSSDECHSPGMIRLNLKRYFTEQYMLTLTKIGAAQVAFINKPSLELDFTDAANIADSFLLKNTIRNTILGIISGMAVLPNRFLVKLDANNDWFKTYQYHHGILRLTVEKATGIAAPKKKSGASRLLAKIVKDVPDCYVKVNVGAEEEWRTTVQKNNHEPTWNETHDFLVTDFDQAIAVDIQDDDLAGDDDIGLGQTTIKDILLKGGSQELILTHKGEPSDARLTVHAKFYNLVADASVLSAQNSAGQGEGQICGLATILIASVLNLTGQRDELNPSVQVTWSDKKFQTAAKTYTPGTDIFNPSFDQAFKIPLTSDMLANPGNFKISLMNKSAETRSFDLSFQDVLGAPGMVREDSFDVGSGALVRASISLHGIQLADLAVR